MRHPWKGSEWFRSPLVILLLLLPFSGSSMSCHPIYYIPDPRLGRCCERAESAAGRGLTPLLHSPIYFLQIRMTVRSADQWPAAGILMDPREQGAEARSEVCDDGRFIKCVGRRKSNVNTREAIKITKVYLNSERTSDFLSSHHQQKQQQLQSPSP